MEIYNYKSKSYSEEVNQINKKYNAISLFRLVSIILFLGFIFYYLKTHNSIYSTIAFFLFVLFVILMRLHSKLVFQKQVKEALTKINKDEYSYLEKQINSFENGEEYNDFHHPYAYDLDIFGAHSLFQHLNRTATFVGKKALAKQLLIFLPNSEINDNHQAVKELTNKLDWRQEFGTFAKISNDSQSAYETLLQWSKFNSKPLSKINILLSFVAPAAFMGLFVAYLVSSNPVFLSYLSYSFIFNLAVLGNFLKRIQIEIANSSDIDKIIKHYSFIVKTIENESFQSKKLLDLQQKLKYKDKTASIHLKELSALFGNMDSISNFVTAILFNGTFLFNLHVLKAMIQWKNNHATALEQWLLVIGEFEMLNSLANFSYNNPDFVYPRLNSEFKIDFENLSHPLLNSRIRIGNNVSFNPESFMILTGSNMSGKSTFLRSLGINMVLTGIGAPVCASQANVHPLPVLVSMRLSDSLSDSESYFFAEIKRLKLIMNALENQPAFVLLDEILRGTNSDDKRNGTIEVVKKVIAKSAIGAIATHDIEVCLTTNDYATILTNKCFEVEIKNDELHFDYKLRDGICKNKSATFLMKKMGVI